MSSWTRDYIMEHEQEGNRLARKVDPNAWVEEYLAPHLHDGMRVLDVGCGSGVLTAQIARLSPSIHVVGLDQSQQRLDEALERVGGLNNAALKQGDALALPFEEGAFDVVFCRFLLEYLKDRRSVIHEMVRVSRAGGLVLLQDLDGQLLWHHPVDPVLQSGLETVVRSLATTGFDPFVGRKLFHLAHQARLTELDVRVEPYHLIAGRIDADSLKNWKLKFDIALPAARHSLGSQRASELRTRFLDYLSRPDSLTYSVVFTVVGRKAANDHGEES